MSDIRITQLPVITEINDENLILVQTDNDTNTIKYSDLLGSIVNKDTLNVNKLAVTENVGIGTTTPLRQVHIKSCTTDYAGKHPLIVEGCTHSVIELRAGDTTSTVGIDFGDQTLDGNGGSHPGSIIYDNSTDKMRIQTNELDRITILNSGNVGVGTSTPTEALTITGNLTASGNISSDSISVSGNISSDNLNKITSHQIDTLSSFEYFEAFPNTGAQKTAGQAISIYSASVDTCGSYDSSNAKYTFCNTGYYSVMVNGITCSTNQVDIDMICNNGSDVEIGRVYACAQTGSENQTFVGQLNRLFNKGETLQLKARGTTCVFANSDIADSIGRWTIALQQRLNG